MCALKVDQNSNKGNVRRDEVRKEDFLSTIQLCFECLTSQTSQVGSPTGQAIYRAQTENNLSTHSSFFS